MKFYKQFFITIGIFSLYCFPVHAQSPFSGLIFSEKKEGVKIVEVQSGSPGFDAGLRKDDVILEIDGEKIQSISDYVSMSRKLKDKRVEVPLVILRKEVQYDATIRVYSIPIYQYWKEKVTKPVELPQGITNTPYVYWVGKGYRTVKTPVHKESFDVRVGNYNTALEYFFHALHYRPESIETALQIANVYYELGSLYMEKGIAKEGVIHYRKSMKYYDGCYKKTEEKESLNKILTNLRKIEKELSKIDSNKTEPPAETQRQSMRIVQ